jgi:hypothetical protein
MEAVDQAEQAEISTRRRARPVGLTLVLLMCFLLYTALPLLSVLYPLLIVQRFEADGGIAGAEFTGGQTVQTVLSAVFGVVLVLAWLGRPRWIRWALLAMLVLQAALVLVNGFIILSQPPGWDAMSDLQRSLQPVFMPSAVLLALGIGWYINRAPAVAFFTGKPIEYIEDTEADDADGAAADQS